MKQQIRISLTSPPLARLTQKAEMLSTYQLKASMIMSYAPAS